MAPVLLLLDLSMTPSDPAPAPGGPALSSVSAVIGDLLRRARTAGAVVIHVREAAAGEDTGAAEPPGGHEPLLRPLDGEPVVHRTRPNAFAGSGLAGLVPVGAEVVVAGMHSESVVRATALAALDRGHRVVLVRGAHASLRAGVPREIEATLRAAGVVVAAPETVTFDGNGAAGSARGAR
ncbi:isochorismatase family protein [Streptomyces johnsoniae]|uniref:Isochorismatase family protein n=1 Tax=Streptomyces johnsoniae TaxID=3075532 RepID=A0ABU2SEE5_9ACTN|nr:isochorismatase family protein [Streptomyces sp. DSM 41886]MDT0446100.1 isochorismatase family protein [Streptomyces sp. DSM 41886]